MNLFNWTNEDVCSWLDQICDRRLKLKEVGAKILSIYARKFNLSTISRHVPNRKTEKLTIIPISSKFGGSIKAVKLGHGKFHLYRFLEKTSTVNRYRCYGCDRIRSKDKEIDFLQPMLSESIETGECKLNGAAHYENCERYTENEVRVKDLDRKMREEVRSDETALPMSTWEKYEMLALKESENKGKDVTDPSSLAMKFPTYEEVRYQLSRHRRAGVMNVEDPFELPELYKITKTKERWELLSDRLEGIALFSSDRNLKAAAQCKYLAVDATFEVCPKSFRQLLTIHGLQFATYFDLEWLSKPLQLWNFNRQSIRTNNACEGFHSFLKRRPGSLRKPGYARLFHLLYTIEYQQSRRIIKLREGTKVKPKSKMYKQLNDRLEELWRAFEERNNKSRKSIDVLSSCRSFLRKAARLVSDVGGTGLRTVKAEKVSQSRKTALLNVVPAKKKKRSSIEEVTVKTKKPVALLFNPPSPKYQESVCKTLGIQWKASHIFGSIFTFINSNCAKPASVLPIEGDGNCGFRALSMGLTGSEDHHRIVRKKIAKFLAEHVDEDWCRLLMTDEEALLNHVKNVAVLAKDASDRDSYARDLDFAAASKLFQVNVLVYSTAGWRVYSPDLNSSWKKSRQNTEIPSIPIKFTQNHFELVLSV